MEHKLIQGGEQFLPFARSRIKALRATGLTYASQQFEVDGVSVNVRIAGEHEYITLSGGSSLSLESGLVDLLTLGPVAPDYLKVAYRDNAETLAYFAKFTDERKNPENTSAGQFAGTITITGKKIRGALGDPSDTASGRYAFAPIITAPEDDPLRDTGASLVAARKNTMSAVPASIFTGRCRLYVQAMYGAYLRNGNPVSGTLHKDMYSALGSGLALRDHSDRGKAAGASEPIYIYTSSGVIKDPAGNFWLIPKLTNDASQALAYRLRSSPDGEYLNKAIKTMDLSDEDRRHAEAYVLSQCLPDSKTTITYTAPAGGFLSDNPGLCMGWGWHWNYSGTALTITTNDVIDELSPEGVLTPMTESVTQSLAVSWGTDETNPEKRTLKFTNTSSLAKERWTLNRFTIMVLYPQGGVLTKWLAGMRTATPFVHQPITFYSFYVGDTLKRCTIETIRTTSTAGRFSCTPFYFQTPAWLANGSGGLTNRTAGLEGGSSEAKNPYTPTVKVILSCDAATTGPLPYSDVEVSSNVAVGEKVLTGGVPQVTPGGLVTNYLPGDVLNYGRNNLDNWPNSIGDPDHFILADYATVNVNWAQTTDYSVSSFTKTITKTSWGFLSIPATDSEAVYLRSNTTTTENRTDLRSLSASSNNYIIASQYTYTAQPPSEWLIWENSDVTEINGELLMSSGVVSPDTTVSTSSGTSWFVGAKNVVVPTNYSLDPLIFENVPDILDKFPTYTPASKDFAVGADKLPTLGSSITLPAIIGWV